MEINGGAGGRRRMSRETSPDRARPPTTFAAHKERGRISAAAAASARKVHQVVYYLSRNGQLEHPHFMEISNLPLNHHLRLKDVIDRLTVLRGRGMPSLFSWSCKRTYKNGYVWNDLSENDVIYPADGVEYVIKGSEIIHGCIPPNTGAERFHHLQIGSKHNRALPRCRPAMEEEEEEEAEEEMEDDDAGGYTAASDHPAGRCHRGVSTDEIERRHHEPKPIDERAAHRLPLHTEITLDDSPPSSSSSDKTPAAGETFRFEDGDPITGPTLSRSSVLLQLISCGRTAAGSGGLLKSAAAPAIISAAGRESGGSLLREAASRAAAAAAVAAEEAELRCMSENPRRVGNPLLEEKEYFSGSIVEAMAKCGRAAAAGEPALKKSSSYNEERGAKLVGMGEEEKKESYGVKGKCIPGRKRSSAKQQE